jgi:hypothetical protein
MKDLNPSKARNIKKATTYLRQLGTIFRIDARNFESEERCILYATQFLTVPAEDRWWQRYPASVDEGLTFNDFKSFAYDAEVDTVNRGLAVAISYDEARQGANQKVADFEAYLAKG